MSNFLCVQMMQYLHSEDFMLSSVTRLGDFLNFWQIFKAFGSNNIAQITHICRQFFVKVSKYLISLVKSFLGNFIDIWRLFTGHTDCCCQWWKIIIEPSNDNWTPPPREFGEKIQQETQVKVFPIRITSNMRMTMIGVTEKGEVTQQCDQTLE